MKKLTYTELFSPLMRPVAWAAVLTSCAQSVAWAQATPLSQRERTRQAVEQVQADQPGQYDESRTLGRTLDLRGQNLPLSSSSQSVNSNNLLAPEVKESGVRYDQLVQWPNVLPLGERRVIARPSGATDLNVGQAVYTPDFSRQRLTLSLLAGKPIVDLPYQELADINPDATPLDVVIDEADAFGLPDMVNLGLSYSPVMTQAYAQLSTATNRAMQARSDLLPTVSARISRGREQSEGANVAGLKSIHTSTSSALRLTQPLFNAPVLATWQSELSNQSAADWKMRAAREAVSLSVSKAVIDLAAARLVVGYADEQLAGFTKLLNYVEARAQSGATSAADLERVRTRVLFARQVRIEQQAIYKNALLEVERLTGQAPKALRLPYLNQLPGLPVTQAELRRLVWEHSYELKALRSDIEAQRKTWEAKRGSLLPVAGLSLERDQSRNVRGENPSQTDTRLMGVLSWDFSLGGKQIFGARGAESELSNREAKLAEQEKRVMQGVDADFASLQSATLRVATGQAEELAAEAVVRSVNEQLSSGRVGASLLEALDAYDRQFSARQRLTVTLTQQMQAQAQLLARMGVLSGMKDSASVEMAPAATQADPVLSAPAN